MQSLSTDYIAELGRQLATLSAFLGGCAAAFLATLLAADRTSRVAGAAAASAAIAAGTFIVAVVAATLVVMAAHPNAPAALTGGSQATVARAVAAFAFAVGIYALLASLGLSGWIRSRRLGRLTSTVAVLAGLLIAAVTTSIGR
jgi:hypothetical protein